jgi:hypothetical protein
MPIYGPPSATLQGHLLVPSKAAGERSFICLMKAGSVQLVFKSAKLQA